MYNSVCLLIPPLPFLEEPRRNCPLGILYVAASLEKAGYNTKVVDLRGNGQTKIPEAEVYGISITSADLPYALEIASKLKGRVIMGGPGTLGIHRDGFTVVRGEGEKAILTVMEDKHLAYIDGSLTEDLDSLPFPARHLLPKESVISTSLCHQGVPASTIITSRGCPFSCTYCSSPQLWQRRVRRHSPEYTLQEIAGLVKDYGIKELRFQDDEANLDKEWLKAIAEGMAELGIKWRCNARAEVGNWEYLKEAGCCEIAVGVETANPLAHKIHKGVDLEKTERGIWRAYQAGLDIRLFFIIGLPYDNGDISRRTIKFLEEMPPLVGVHLNVFSPFPGCDIGDHPEKYGIEILTNPGSILSQEGKPIFSYRFKDRDMKELEYHYLKLRQYIKERRWILA